MGVKKKAEKAETSGEQDFIDAEIRAIQAILAVLMPLTDRQQARVHWYVQHYFQIG
jgi:hypothetical protein